MKTPPRADILNQIQTEPNPDLTADDYQNSNSSGKARARVSDLKEQRALKKELAEVWD